MGHLRRITRSGERKSTVVPGNGRRGRPFGDSKYLQFHSYRNRHCLEKLDKSQTANLLTLSSLLSYRERDEAAAGALHCSVGLLARIICESL